jgi:hypothetical protein
MRIRVSGQINAGRTVRSCLLVCALVGSAVVVPAYGQVSLSTGSVQGEITDPSGAVVPGARVVLTRPSTGLTQTAESSSSGLYSFGNLTPGEYRIHVEAAGFSQVDESLTVQVGNVVNGNVRLALASGTQVVNVSASAVTLNTEQATVQGVLSAEQIQQLPINGRNFLDLAQLEPGVQIQDGQNFDPTKAGFSSISFGGRFGRTARIEVDGVDVSDETVGTTTTDIPSSAIQEFQVAQSSLDVSTELTSSGTVNVTTKSGTNRVHGEAFDFFRDFRIAAALPHPPSLSAPYFQRSQFGGNLGGPLWRDRLFLFGDGERTKQDEQSPVLLDSPFTFLSGNFPTPFREGIGLGRLDANLGKGIHAFYRYNLYHSAIDATFGFGYQAYTSKNQTFEHVVGADFATGNFTHSVRYSYLKFENQIVDAVRGSNLPFATSPVSIDIGSLDVGTNFLAPQDTPQSDDILKYDGSWLKGRNIVRYGFSYNHNEAGGTADFYGLNPTVIVTPGASEVAMANAGPFPALSATDPNGKADNPYNYPAETVTISNDVGFSTEKPGLGFPGGLLGPDNRIGLYAGDSFKPLSNLNIELALRYVHDTGRTDSDLPPITAIDQYFPGEGNRVNQPDANFAPQFGAVWDPFKKGLTVIRAGVGLYYENIIYNNALFDRPLRLTKGAFLNVQNACTASTAQTLATSSGSITPAPGLCGGPIGQVGSGLAAFETAFIQGNPPNPNDPNAGYVGNDLAGGFNVGTESDPSGLFAPNFKTPRSLQMNIGVQQQLHRGLVLSADYLRNVETHSLLNVDLNHVGDASLFNAAGAAAAITATESECGATSVQGAIDNCPNDVDGTGHADINDFAGNGLTASWENGGSVGCPSVGCAFAGIHPSIGNFYMMESIGRSVYNGLDLKLVGDLRKPFPGLHRLNTQVSYSLSRFINTGGWNAGGATGNSDQDFVIAAVDNRNPLKYAGPSLLDRTNQLSFGFIADVPARFQLSSTAHFYGGLAQSLNLQPNGNLGEIYRTDVTGDGTTQDLLPGTKIGSFGRGVSAGNLNQHINDFNSTFAGQATPAGQTLISNGLFTLPQLQTIGATVQPIATAPAGQVGMAPLKALDAKLSWVGSFFNEHLTLTPSAGFYNLFNFANFDLPGTTLMNGQLQNAPAAGQTVTPGFVNSTTYAQRITDRVGVGTGVFGLGSPRALEFGLDFTF